MNNKTVDDIIEESIMDLYEDFKQNPESFSDEKILTYKFYDIIISKNLQEHKFRWEYPTKAFYRGDTPDDSAKKPKYIDICFIKDNSSDSVPYALEFKLLLNKIDIKKNQENEFCPSKFNTIDSDFDELCYPINKINSGYILFFAFGRITDNSGRKEAHNENKIKFFNKYEELNRKIHPSQKIKVIFVCVDNLDGKCTCSIKHNLNNGFPIEINKEYDLT